MGRRTLDLQIQTLLQVADEHRSQVFMVELCRQSGDYLQIPQSKSTLVAKVFDPLTSMDQFYTHEAGTYQALKKLQGQGIPHYYGSYSISLPLPDESHGNREVRMVFLEYIQKIPMSRAEPEKLSEASRQRIISSNLELESKIYANDICLNDLCPRNIILIDHDSPDPSVVFVDFDNTLFQRGKNDDKAWDLPGEGCLGQYIFPLIRGIPCQENFDEWVDWD